MKNTPLQLTLVTTDRPWKIDAETRRIGLTGLAKARAILAERTAEQNARLAAESVAADTPMADLAA